MLFCLNRSAQLSHIQMDWLADYICTIYYIHVHDWAKKHPHSGYSRACCWQLGLSQIAEQNSCTRHSRLGWFCKTFLTAAYQCVTHNQNWVCRAVFGLSLYSVTGREKLIAVYLLSAKCFIWRPAAQLAFACDITSPVFSGQLWWFWVLCLDNLAWRPSGEHRLSKDCRPHI